jgi:hypothetical protein
MVCIRRTRQCKYSVPSIDTNKESHILSPFPDIVFGKGWYFRLDSGRSSRSISSPERLGPFHVMAITRPSANESKLRELIIYISSMMEKDDAFGVTKLNKILFRADFTAYVQFGKPITGVEYFALYNGPSPRPMKKLLEMMQAKGEIVIRKEQYMGGTQQRIIPLRSAELENKFSVSEMDLVFRLIHHYWGKSGTTMSGESHEFLGWSLARLKETIPYHVALVGDRDPTPDEISRGLQLQSMAEECLARNAARKPKPPNRNRGRAI